MTRSDFGSVAPATFLAELSGKDRQTADGVQPTERYGENVEGYSND